MFFRKNRRPLGLKRRVAYSFVLLIACMAVVCALSVRNAFEFVEQTLTNAYMSDVSSTLLQLMDEGETVELPESMALYGELPGLEPIPVRYLNTPMGYSELADDPAVFVYRDVWEGRPVILVRDQSDFEKTERRMWFLTLLAAVSAIVVSVILCFVLSRRIMRPVETLSEAVRQAAGNNSYKAIPREIMTNDEVGVLAQICDASLQRLYKALKREKAFTNDVSHELRTPLTVIETSSELLELSSLTPQQAKQVARILRATDQIRSSMTLFLKLARGENNLQESASDHVSDLVGSVLETWKTEAERKNIRLERETRENCPGLYSPVLLGTVLNNLVKNAVAYCPEGGRVVIVELHDGVLVADNGPGISTQEQDDVFKPFVRGRASLSSGEGLGLSIVHRICERCGWYICLLAPGKRSEAPAWAQGAVFKLTLAEADSKSLDTK